MCSKGRNYYPYHTQRKTNFNFNLRSISKSNQRSRSFQQLVRYRWKPNFIYPLPSVSKPTNGLDHSSSSPAPPAPPPSPPPPPLRRYSILMAVLCNSIFLSLPLLYIASIIRHSTTAYLIFLFSLSSPYSFSLFSISTT